MTAFPDRISMDDLQEIMQEATERNEARRAEERERLANNEAFYDGKTREEVIAIANQAVQWAASKCTDPIVHKVMMSMIITNMIGWHTRMGQAEAEEGCTRSAVAWLRDAGKFQSMHNIMDLVSVGPHDFINGEVAMTSDNDDDEDQDNPYDNRLTALCALTGAFFHCVLYLS